MIDKDTYILRVQGYKYLAAENSSETVLRTYIEVLKFPGEMDVVTFTGEGTQLIGYLMTNDDLTNENPDFWDVPKFIPNGDEFYADKRATYFGDTGFELAKQELAEISKLRLAQGIKRHLIKDYERDIILYLRMYDACRRCWFTVKETQLKAFKAPEIYKWDNYVFRLVLTADEDEKTTAFYTLSGKYH